MLNLYIETERGGNFKMSNYFFCLYIILILVTHFAICRPMLKSLYRDRKGWEKEEEARTSSYTLPLVKVSPTSIQNITNCPWTKYIMKFCYIIETQFKQLVTKLGLSYVLPSDYFVINLLWKMKVICNYILYNTYILWPITIFASFRVYSDTYF